MAIRVHPGNVIVDSQRLLTEPGILARRHGVPIDRLAARRRLAWGLLRAGRRMAAVREYAGLVVAGDLRSLGRAVVALIHPAVGTEMFAFQIPQDRGWADMARVWLDPLAKHCARFAKHH